MGIVSVVVASSAACAATPRGSGPLPRLATATTGPAPRDVGAPEPARMRRAKLSYEVRGRPFPLPIVKGTIAGHRVLMLVDTGANSHVVAGWFARKVGLSMKKLGDVGTDHVGKSIATYRLETPAISLDDWGALEPTDVLATDVPEVIERLGIGAFISPQRLVEDGDAVVLDLAKGELRAAWWDDAFVDLSKGGVSLVNFENARTCEETEGPIKGLAFVVPAVIARQRADLLLDTGAQHSDVFTTSSAGQKLAGQSAANREPMYTASGKISARKLKSVTLSSGSYSVVTDVDLIGGTSDASCPRDGVLAMDVLRSCTLLLGRTKVAGRCLPPPQTSHAKKE